MGERTRDIEPTVVCAGQTDDVKKKDDANALKEVPLEDQVKIEPLAKAVNHIASVFATKKNFWERISTLRNKIRAPKSKYNSFGDFHYRSLSDVEAALKPLLPELNLFFEYQRGDVEIIGDVPYITVSGAIRDMLSLNIINYTYQTRIDEHKPKMDWSQSLGSAETYAKKRVLDALLLLDDGLDSESEKPAQNQSSQAGDGRISKVQYEQYLSANRKFHKDPGFWMKRFKLQKASDMTVSQFNIAMKSIEGRK